MKWQYLVLASPLIVLAIATVIAIAKGEWK